jgi:hypothetical protein
VPAQGSLSSVSPQRRAGDQSSIAYSNQRTFSYTNPLPSPGGLQTQYNGGQTYPHPSGRGNRRIMPTPEHTTASAMSDEDVAYQLMRLGDMSNFSTHGRTSTSTNNDAFSSMAAASDDENDGYSGDEDDPREGVESGEDYDDVRDASFNGNNDEIKETYSPKTDLAHPPKRLKSNSGKPKQAPKLSKPRLQGTKSKPKTPSNGKAPPSPASLPTSRKASVASSHTPLGPDEQDLSSRPRCQRCRKSKKGCDRQRPCGRCKDAGLGIDDCISEDEGNGRKGRYGRYMGVPVKKDGTFVAGPPLPHPVQSGQQVAPPIPTVEDGMELDPSGKKRKR